MIVDLKTLEILTNIVDVLPDSENIIYGAKIDSENKKWIVLQSKSGFLSLLEIIISEKGYNIRKIKDIELKIIGFLKFCLNPMDFKWNESEKIFLKSDFLMEQSFFVYPNYEENNFVCQSYDDKILNKISFSKQVSQNKFIKITI